MIVIEKALAGMTEIWGTDTLLVPALDRPFHRTVPSTLDGLRRMKLHANAVRIEAQGPSWYSIDQRQC